MENLTVLINDLKASNAFSMCFLLAAVIGIIKPYLPIEINKVVLKILMYMSAGVWISYAATTGEIPFAIIGMAWRGGYHKIKTNSQKVRVCYILTMIYSFIHCTAFV